MSARAAAWLAWSMWALCVVLGGLAVLLDFYTSPVPASRGPNFDVFAGVLLLVYPTVGAFVVWHRPKNAVGWVLCGMGLVFEVSFFAGAYADYALSAHPDPLLGARYMAWLASWVTVPVVGLATLLLLLFPSGRVPSGMLFAEGRLPARSWQVVVWMAVCGSALVALWKATLPGPLEAWTLLFWDPNPSVGNPLGIRGTAGVVVEIVGKAGSYLLLVSLVFAAVSLISRWVLAKGEERQQIKWFVFAAAMMIAGFPAMVMVSMPLLILQVLPWVEPWEDSLWSLVYFLGWGLGQFIAVLGLLFLPIAVGVAILKYRLYDIDLLINRTIVYGALTGILALVYLGSVVALQALFRSLTGQGSQLAIVASTLAIAALFGPLRSRIQTFIDRRFYRRKYDATKTLQAFSAKLRDETDLDALRADLVGVVRESMQPAHVALWLRPDDTPPKVRQEA
jgi:hypothetical protein